MDDITVSSSKIGSIAQISGTIPKEVQEIYGKNNSPKRSRVYKDKTRKTQDGFKNTKINQFFARAVSERSTAFGASRPQECAQHSTVVKSIEHSSSIKKAKDACSEAKCLATELSTLTGSENLADVIKKNAQMILKAQEAQESLIQAFIQRDADLSSGMTKQLSECTTYVAKELNVMRNEIDKIKADDGVERLTTVAACQKDLRKIFIRFTFLDDIENLRSKNSPIEAVKKILAQIGVDLYNSPWPIESANFQSKTFSFNQVVPETALECFFVNSTIANRVKTSIRSFNNKLEANGKVHLIRYRVASDFSFTTRRLLKICNEMRRCDIVNKVAVTNDGIKVHHNEITRTYQDTARSRKFTSSFCNSMNQLDEIRRDLKDFNFQVQAINVYTQSYFAQSVEARDRIRSERNDQFNAADQSMEVTINDDDLSGNFDDANE